MGSGSRREHSLAGVPVKYILWSALVAQNVALALLIHYSRVMPLVNGHRYYSSTAVLLSEILKFAFFLSTTLYEIATSPQTPDTSTISELSTSLSKAVLTGDSWRLAIPAALFTIQNNLQYTAASNLDAATFSVTYQLKVASTVVFACLLLGKLPNVRKGLSIALMVLGVAIVQLSYVSREGRILSIKDLKDGVSFHSPRSIWEMEADGSVTAGQLGKRSATYEGIDEDFAAANPRRNATIGLAAVWVACLISGLACVFFERTLKAKVDTRASVWVRNLQLSFYSIWPTLFIGVLFMDGEHVAKTGFFTGYNWIVWVVIVLQAAGGILVALALHHFDSVTKSFATSVSALLTFLISVLFLEFHTTVTYLLGIVVAAGSAFIYNTTPEDKRARPPPINITSYEKNGEPGYFDLEAATTAAKSPLRDPTRGALSTSRPTTPVTERRPARSKSSEVRYSKRDQ